MQNMVVEGKSYITQKHIEANNKIYGDEYHCRRDAKEAATSHNGDKEISHQESQVG